MSGRTSVVRVACLLTVILGLAGCQVGGPDQGLPGGPLDEPAADPEQRPLPERELGGQQICMLGDVGLDRESCPEVTDPPETWTVAPLFDDGSGDWGQWRALPPTLRRYCLYSGQGEFPGEQWQKEQGMVCQLDAELIAPLQTAGDKELIAAFGPAFRQGVGRPTTVPTQATPTVRLAILDGFETTTPPVDTESHGGSLYHIARDLLCEDLHAATPECAAEVTTGVALPVEVDPGNPAAGHVGRPSDLVHALYGAVGPWGGSPAQDPLVINLSLGWDPQHGGMADKPTTINAADIGDHPRLSAVYDALHYAQCSGALVFAAVGNQTALGESDPLLPAVWGAKGYLPETLLATATPCQARFGPGMGTANDARPLLYPVGAVDDDRMPLAVSRPNSEPEAVAFGAHGTVETRGRPTMPMSGTSLSTLVVSTSAALMWSRDTGVEPQDVYDGILGDDLGRPVALWFDDDPPTPSGGPPVRLVRLCGPNMGLQCPTQQSPAPVPDLTVVRAGLEVVDVGSCDSGFICTASVASEFAYSEEPTSCLVSEVSAMRRCDGTPPDTALDLCNHVVGQGGESALRQPILFPMPPGRRCPYCLTVANAADPMLIMKTTDVMGPMFGAELLLKDAQGGVLAVVDLGMVPVPQNSEVALPDGIDYADVSRSVLSGLHKEPGGMVSAYLSLVQVTHQQP